MFICSNDLYEMININNKLYLKLSIILKLYSFKPVTDVVYRRYRQIISFVWRE